MRTGTIMKRKLIATIIVGFSAVVLGSMALTPSPSYGSAASDVGTKQGAAAGAAAGQAAAEAEQPIDESDDSAGGSCGGG